MLSMRNTLIALVVLVVPATARADDLIYEGTWITTNRPLTGTMTCVVTDQGNNQWRGHFYGIWQGVQFSYKVRFSGPPEMLKGKAIIDGADYEWTGTMTKGTPGSLKGSFTGGRYEGSFDLKRKSK